MSENSGDLQSQECRPLPLWAWALSILLFPAGVFVALAASRALRWRTALLLCLATYAVAMPFICTLRFLPPDMHLASSSVNTGLLLLAIAVGQLQYAIGRSHGVWTARGRRMWKFFAAIAVVFLGVGTLAALLHVVILLLRNSAH